MLPPPNNLASYSWMGSKELYPCLRQAEFHVEEDHDIPGPGHTLLVARPL